MHAGPEVKRTSSIAVVFLLLSQKAATAHPLKQEERASFRKAVEDYQLFVVPRCAPEAVRAYVDARADRDRAFVRSLRHTKLEADYRQAVADRAAKDERIVFHCFGPPPPPPPPPGAASSPHISAQTVPQQQDALAQHFAEGDRQFETMVGIRDSSIGPPSK
jgi:hypothetical protein